MRKVRWGVIGCGGIARTRTIPGMLLAENAQLVSVMARDLASAQAVQEQFGAADHTPANLSHTRFSFIAGTDLQRTPAGESPSRRL